MIFAFPRPVIGAAAAAAVDNAGRCCKNPDGTSSRDGVGLRSNSSLEALRSALLVMHCVSASVCAHRRCQSAPRSDGNLNDTTLLLSTSGRHFTPWLAE